MEDLMSLVFQCESVKDLMSERNRIVRQLPLELRKRWNFVFMAYSIKYGMDGVYERVNGRTVATILDEFVEADAPKPIESGTVNGMRFQLFDPPSKETGDAPRQTGTDEADK